MYNPKSLKADEFINHQEIIDTLDYAEKNKNNLELINKILEKAELLWQKSLISESHLKYF